MSLPQFLLVELRLAFRKCAPRPSPACRRFVSNSRTKPSKSTSTAVEIEQDHASSKHASNPTVSVPEHTSPGREVVPQESQGRSVSSELREDVPLKVIPKAQLTPNLTISPLQRLHIEALTRRPPQVTIKKNVYKERLLIYHFGTGREKFLILLKFAAIFSAGFVEAIVVPAHLAAGTSWWLVGLFSLGGLLPFGLIHAITKPWVTRIFLHLPPHARQTPKTAMDYARNLPANARLDIEYLRPVPLPAQVTASIFDLAPANEWWRMVTFRWVGHRADTGTFLKRNPTDFYVKPQSSRGKAARFTIPGIWANVYQRLTGVQPGTVSKWKR